MNAADHPQVQALAALYRRPPDRPNDEAPPGERRGFKGSQTNGHGLRNKSTSFHATTASAEPILSRLEGVQKSGNGWRARCPACGGTSRKLSIAERDNRVLIHCFACADAAAVLAAVGLTWPELQPPRNWPPNPREAQRAIRAVGIESAVEVLATEGIVIRMAARQIQGWGHLSADDDDRLALACDRIERAALVLSGKAAWRPSSAYEPRRWRDIKRGSLEALRRQVGDAERELAKAEAAFQEDERRKAAEEGSA